MSMPGSEIVDATAAFTGTVEPNEVDHLDKARLTAWMKANVQGFEGPLTQAKFKGGQSNPTYRISTPTKNYVLRRKPFGSLLPSAHAVDREFRVQSGLHKLGFPVARQFGLCTDDDVLGSWFYVMEMVEGRTIWDGAMPRAVPQERRGIYFELVDTLAALHNVDPTQAGLDGFGKPGNYFARQVGRWTKQYRLSETEMLPSMEKLIEYLPATLPDQTRTSVVHGDYRIDNMIFAHDTPRVLAVLDWELSTLGDPMSDFTYLCMMYVTENEGRSGVMDVDRKALGIPELDETVERYCAATNRTEAPDLNWYFAFNFFRLAGILQGIKKRVLDGTANSAHAKAQSDRITPLADQAWDFAKRARGG